MRYLWGKMETQQTVSLDCWFSFVKIQVKNRHSESVALPTPPPPPLSRYAVSVRGASKREETAAWTVHIGIRFVYSSN